MDRKFVVDFKDCISHESIIEKLNFAFELKSTDNVDVTLDFYYFKDFLYPDYALLIIAMMEFARKKAKSIKGRITNLKKKSPTFKYLERMNFFKLIGADFVSQTYNNTNGDFLEISKYSKEVHGSLIESIINIVKKNLLFINPNVLLSLDYCLGELLDNIDLYSGEKEGYVVVQYYATTSKIRLLICDTGLGITYTLNKDRVEKLSSAESLRKCIEKNVTGGLGQGHGLFATSTFIEENRGLLKILSGDCKLDFKGFEKRQVVECPYWKGTLVFLDINTNVDVDYKKFTSEFFDQKEIFEERLW